MHNLAGAVHNLAGLSCHPTLEQLDCLHLWLFVFAPCCACSDGFHKWSSIANLTPAAEHITDIPRFVRCLKAVVPEGAEQISNVLHLPAVQQLQSSDWFEILQCCLQSIWDGLPRGFDQIPAVQQMAPDQLAQLLRLATQHNPMSLDLTSLPAAQQLQPDDIADVLLLLLQPRKEYQWKVDSKAVRALLGLPGAGLIPVARVQELVVAAVRAGLYTAAQLMLELFPQVEEVHGPFMSGKLIVECFVAACKLPTKDDLCALLAEMQEWRAVDDFVEPAGICTILLEAVSAMGSTPGLSQCMIGWVRAHILRLPACQGVAPDYVLQLLQECIRQGVDGFAVAIMALPAAAALPVSQVHALLRLCLSVKVQAASVWQGLLQLPGGCQVDSQQLEELLLGLLKGVGAWACPEILQLLVKHPASVVISSTTFVGLVEKYIQQSGWGQEFVPPLLLLPAAWQLTPQEVRPLLLRAMRMEIQSICAALCELPGVVCGWQ